MNITIEYHKRDNDPRNYDWFCMNWQMLDLGGKLFTSAGGYVKTAEGFVKVK